MKTSTLTTLSRRLDKTLTHFALAANAGGQYPWEVAEQQKRNRQMVGTAVGVTAIGAGAYGAKKGHEAIMKRGLPMAQAAAGGPVRTRDAYKAVAGEGLDKVKEKAGAAWDATGGRAVKYGKNVVGKYGSMRAGASAGLGLGRRGAIMAALKHVKFSRADVLVELEAQIDGALQEFAMRPGWEAEAWKARGSDEDVARRRRKVNQVAGAAAIVAGAYGADRAIMGRAKKKMGFTPTRAEAYGEGVKDVMKSGKRLYRKGKAHASYHAEPLLRKAKDMMGLRKVAGMLK